MPFVSSIRGTFGPASENRGVGRGDQISELVRQDPFSPGLPSGGTITTAGGYRIHTFTDTGTTSFNLNSISNLDVEILLVGGGGGVGGIGGGGGGGGVVYGSTTVSSPSNAVTVGVGGSSSPSYPGNPGQPGGASSFNTGTLYVARGGGSSSDWSLAGPNGAFNPLSPGGSGAGGSGSPSGGQPGGLATQSSQANPGMVQAGFPGARGGTNPHPGGNNATTGAGQYSAGGGGGSAQAGGHPTQTGPGNTSSNTQAGRKGGNGLSYSISGTATNYGGGGGGAKHSSSGYNSPDALALGGLGGGGNGGAINPNNRGGGGVDGLGGGAGAGDYIGSGSAGGLPGGSGVVIVRYLI